jgi:hypothetical protein
MESLLCKCGLLYNGDGDLKGAQTVRRFGAGPVGSLLGRKDPTGRLLILDFGFWILDPIELVSMVKQMAS